MTILERLYADDPQYQELSAEERFNFNLTLRQDPEKALNFFSEDKDFRVLTPDEREEFLTSFFTEEPTTIEDSFRNLRRAEQDPQNFLSSIGNSVVASFSRSSAGVLNTLLGGTSELAPLLNKTADEKTQLVGDYLESKGRGVNIAHDILSNVATQGPGILASMKLKLPSIALTQLGVLSFGSAGEEARQAGYGERGAVFRGVTQAAGEVFAGSITLGALLKAAPSTRRYVLDAVAASVASNVPAEVSHRLRDYLMDSLKIEGTKNLAPEELENMTLADFVYDLGAVAGRTAITSAGTGAIYSGTQALSLRVQGVSLRNLSTKTGETVTVATPAPENTGNMTKEEVVDRVDRALEYVASHHDIDQNNAQTRFNQTYQTIHAIDELSKTTETLAKEERHAIEKSIIDGNLDGILIKMQKDKTPELDIQREKRVGVKQKFFATKTNVLGGIPLEGTIVNSYVDDEGIERYNIQLNESDKVAIGDEVGLLQGVPEDMLMPSFEEWRNRKFIGRESNKVVNFFRNLITEKLEGKDLNSLDLKQLQQILGKPSQVSPQLKIKGHEIAGVYTQNRKGEETIRIAADLMAVDARFFTYVLAHEIGHFLHLTRVDSDIAKNGMGQILNFDKTMIEAILNDKLDVDQETKNKLRKSQLDYKAKNEILESIFKEELDAVVQAWSFSPEISDTFEEKIADFFSVLLNNPLDEAGNPLINLTDIAPQLLGVWDHMLQSNEAVKAAWESIETEFNHDEMFKRADIARDVIAKKMLGSSSFYDQLMINLVDTNYVLWETLREHKTPQHIIDEIQEAIARDGQMQLAEERFYLTPIKEILNTLAQEDKRNLDLYAFYNRVAKDRFTTQEFMTPEGKFNYDKLAKIVKQQMRADGSSVEEIVEALDKLKDSHTIKRIVELLNPGGITPDEAIQKLAEMKAEIGDTRYQTIEETFDKFSKFRRNWYVKNMQKEGYEGNLDHAENNENYVRFAVAHWLADKSYVGEGAMSGFHQQKGTTSDILSPIGATMVNDLSMVRNVRKNNIKTRIIETLQALGDIGIIEKVKKKVINKDGKQVVLTPRVDLKKHVPVSIRNSEGKLETYHIDKDIGAGLYNSPNVMEVFDNLNKFVTHKLFSFGIPNLDSKIRRAFTTHNPIFWGNNLLRDSVRSMLNVRGGVKDTLKIPYHWATSLREAWRSLHGDADCPTVNEMAEKGLLATLNRYIGGQLGAEATMADRVLFAKLQDPDIVENDLHVLQNFIEGANVQRNKLLREWDFIGGTMERASKMAAYKTTMEMVQEGKYTHQEALNFVRRHAGTPILTTKGRAALPLSNLFYFYNPRIQGILGDIDAYKRGDWTIPFKRAAWGVSSAIPVMLGLSGVLDAILGTGDDWRKFYEAIPTYHLLRGPIVPLGRTAEGKSAYFIMPSDSVTGLTHAFTMTMLKPIFDNREGVDDVFKHWSEILSVSANNVYAGAPAVNPRLKLASELVQIMAGGGVMPRNVFGRDIIPQHIADEGLFSLRFQTELVKHTLNSLGIAAVYRFPYPSPVPTRGLKRIPETTSEHIFRHIEQAAGVPFLQPLASRITISDAGFAQTAGSRELSQREFVQRKINDVTIEAQSIMANITADDAANGIRMLTDSDAWKNAVNAASEHPQIGDRLSAMLQRIAREASLMDTSPELFREFNILSNLTGNNRIEHMRRMGEKVQKINSLR